MHHELAAAALLGEQNGNHAHGHAPVDFHTGTNALSAKQHVHAHGTFVGDGLQIVCPPLADAVHHVQRDVLAQPLALHFLRSEPIAHISARWSVVEEGKAAVFHTATAVTTEFHGEVHRLVEPALRHHTALLPDDAPRPCLHVGICVGHQSLSAAAPGRLEQRMRPSLSTGIHLVERAAHRRFATHPFASHAVLTQPSQSLHGCVTAGKRTQPLHFIVRGQKTVVHSRTLKLVNKRRAPPPGYNLVAGLQANGFLTVPHSVALVGPPFRQPIEFLPHLSCACRGSEAGASVGQCQIILGIEYMQFHGCKGSDNWPSNQDFRSQKRQHIRQTFVA